MQTCVSSENIESLNLDFRASLSVSRWSRHNNSSGLASRQYLMLSPRWIGKPAMDEFEVWWLIFIILAKNQTTLHGGHLHDTVRILRKSKRKYSPAFGSSSKISTSLNLIPIPGAALSSSKFILNLYLYGDSNWSSVAVLSDLAVILDWRAVDSRDISSSCGRGAPTGDKKQIKTCVLFDSKSVRLCNV